jgi:hypothetical protein
VAAAAWVTGFGAIIAFASARLAVRGASWSPQSARLQIPGSWWPLALIIGLFAIKYIVAVAIALHPALTADLWLSVRSNMFYGAAAAVFWSRSRSLLRLIPPERTQIARTPA